MRVPEGNYVAEVESWDLGLTKSDKLVLHVFCRVVGVPDRERPDAVLPLPDGVIDPAARTDIYFTEKCMDMAFKRLELLGFSGDDLSKLHPAEEGAFDLTGKRVTLYAKDDDYNGKVFTKWEINIPFAKKAKKDLTRESVADLAQASQAWREFKERQSAKAASLSPSQAVRAPF